MKPKTAVILFVATLCLSLIFPPRMEEGQWRNQRTGNVATGRLKRALDRGYYGYIPEYHPIWSHPQTSTGSIGVSIRLRNQDQYQLVSQWLSIDWHFFGIQIPMLALLWSSIWQISQPWPPDKDKP